MVFAHLSGKIFADIEIWMLYISWQKQFSIWANNPQFHDPYLTWSAMRGHADGQRDWQMQLSVLSPNFFYLFTVNYKFHDRTLNSLPFYCSSWHQNRFFLYWSMKRGNKSWLIIYFYFQEDVTICSIHFMWNFHGSISVGSIKEKHVIRGWQWS